MGQSVDEYLAELTATEEHNRQATNTMPAINPMGVYNPTTPEVTDGINKTLGQAKKTDKEAVNEDEKNAVPKDAKRRASENTKDQWGKEAADKALRHYGTNLAQENPYGNLNGMSFRNTRNLSRLADAVNNKLHKGPQSTGYRTNSSFGSQKEERTEGHQWDPITTQEMRQMRANEQVDMSMRQGMVRQQQNVNDYEMDLQRKVDDVAITLSQALGINEVQIQEAARQAVLNINYTLPAQQRIQLIGASFLQRLANATRSEAVAWAYKIWQKNPAVGAYAMQSMTGGMLGLEEFMSSNLYTELMRDPKFQAMSPQQQYQVFTTTQVTAALAKVGAYGDMFKQSIGGILPGIRN